MDLYTEEMKVIRYRWTKWNGWVREYRNGTKWIFERKATRSEASQYYNPQMFPEL